MYNQSMASSSSSLAPATERSSSGSAPATKQSEVSLTTMTAMVTMTTRPPLAILSSGQTICTRVYMYMYIYRQIHVHISQLLAEAL